MDKGVTGMQNVYLLKLGYTSGIQINYNILYGIPNEKTEAYTRMTAMLPRLFHLTPPVTCAETIVTRFAPMQDRPARFGVSVKPRHHRCYDTLFSADFLARTGFALDNYAYYFERYFNYEDDAPPLYWMMCRQVEQWKRQHREREVTLTWEAVDGRLLIRDCRQADAIETWLTPLQSNLYRACIDAPVRRQFLVERHGAEPDAVGETLELFDRLGLIWTEGDLILGLATPHSVTVSHNTRHWQQQWTSLYA